MTPDLLRFSTPDTTVLASRLSAAVLDLGLMRETDEAFLAAVAGADVGIAYTFAEQHDGRLVQDVKPTPGREQDISSQGRVPFRLHTDDAFLDAGARPERLALLGVRNPTEVPTVVVGVDDVLERLTDDTVAALSRPDYQFRCPDSFAVGCRPAYSSPPRPVLRVTADGHNEVALSTRSRTSPSASPGSAEHVRRLRRVADEVPSRDILLEPGEILVVSNSRCLHGRGAVRGDRWLKRVYLRDDLRVLEAVARSDRQRTYVAGAAFEHAERSASAW